MLPPFLEFLEGGQIYVEPPSQLIFLCGGKTKAKSKKLLSIRDAFLKIPDNPALKGRSILLAESVNTFHLSRPAYTNLLDFEVDFAQLCELILLFSESQGSIAELGAFSMRQELASKMLVVVRDYHLKDDSFIKLGPLKHLTATYGDHAEFVLNDDETGIKINSIKNLDLEVLRDRLTPAINARFEVTREKTTFNPNRRGHVIKLLVGLIQIFGGLTADELVELAAGFSVAVTPDDVDRMMLCAEAAKWVKKEHRGFTNYYFSLPTDVDALVARFDKNSPIVNPIRRKDYYREHWKENDDQRFRGIVKFAGGVA